MKPEDSDAPLKKHEITLHPIGTIIEGISRDDENSEKKPSRYHIVSTIQVYPEYRTGLTKLDEWSHAFILWWANEGIRNKLIMEKRENSGVFATRSPHRPNPIMLTLVQLIKIEAETGIIKTRGLDAWTGSLVLDIKPYTYYDMVKNLRVPEWFKECWRKNSRESHYTITVPWLGPCNACLEEDVCD